MSNLLDKFLELKNEIEKRQNAEKELVELFQDKNLPLYTELQLGDTFWFLAETTPHKGMKIEVRGYRPGKYLCLDETSSKWLIFGFGVAEEIKVIPISNPEEK